MNRPGDSTSNLHRAYERIEMRKSDGTLYVRLRLADGELDDLADISVPDGADGPELVGADGEWLDESHADTRPSDWFEKVCAGELPAPYGADADAGEAADGVGPQNRRFGSATLTDVYDKLGIESGEHVSICYVPIGGSFRCSGIYTPADAVSVASKLKGDVYFGVNPISLPLGAGGRRGAERDVTRVVALYADLDVKEDACPELGTAHAIIDDVSAVLGTRPAVVIYSGHGLQPIWTLADASPADGKPLLRMFSRLVRVVARKHDVAKIDSVFELARVLRVPGTANYKDDPPAPTKAVLDTGTPLTAATANERIQGAGVREQDNDHDALAKVVSDPETWAFAGSGCSYAKAAIGAWKTDIPANGRHNMMLDRYVRLAAMWRNGCHPDEAVLQAALDALANRLMELRAGTGECVGDYEVQSMWIWAVDRVSRFTTTQLKDELGNHRHGPVAGWLSDAHVSEMLAEEVLRGKFCWASGSGWMQWDSKKWSRTTNEDIIEHSRIFANALVADIVASGASPDVIRSYTKRLSASAVRAAADLAKGQLLVDSADFDQHPDLLNVNNGIVNLRTGEFSPHHDPKLLFTKCAPTDYHPNAAHPDWDRALAALPDEVRDWMQVRFGQAATGHPTPDDVLCVLNGAGANGKTTITTGIARALGASEFAATVPDRVLLANPNDHPTELMTLRGARVALLEETPETRHLNVKRLKDVLGTTTMTARYIRRDSVTWAPTHSLFVSTNYRPRVEETDHGTWRRLALIAFPYTFRSTGEELRGEKDRRGDPTLRQRIENSPERQHEAVLRWVVDGAVRFHEAGEVMPQAPPAVVEATRKWRRESDLILRFYDDHLIAEPEWFVSSADLYTAFTEWLMAAGHRQWTVQTFTDRFGQHDEITGSGISADRIRLTATKMRHSRLRGRDMSLPKRFRAWVGVRFRAPEDDNDHR